METWRCRGREGMGTGRTPEVLLDDCRIVLEVAQREGRCLKGWVKTLA